MHIDGKLEKKKKKVTTPHNGQELGEYFSKKGENGILDWLGPIGLSACLIIGKGVEKVVAKELSQYCEDYSKLHPGQMGGRKERSAIDTVATLVHTVQESGKRKS